MRRPVRRVTQLPPQRWSRSWKRLTGRVVEVREWRPQDDGRARCAGPTTTGPGVVRRTVPYLWHPLAGTGQREETGQFVRPLLGSSGPWTGTGDRQDPTHSRSPDHKNDRPKADAPNSTRCEELATVSERWLAFPCQASTNLGAGAGAPDRGWAILTPGKQRSRLLRRESPSLRVTRSSIRAAGPCIQIEKWPSRSEMLQMPCKFAHR